MIALKMMKGVAVAKMDRKARHSTARRNTQTRVQLDTTMAAAVMGTVSLTPKMGARQIASSKAPAKPLTEWKTAVANAAVATRIIERGSSSMACPFVDNSA